MFYKENKFSVFCLYQILCVDVPVNNCLCVKTIFTQSFQRNPQIWYSCIETECDLYIYVQDIYPIIQLQHVFNC